MHKHHITQVFGEFISVNQALTPVLMSCDGKILSWFKSMAMLILPNRQTEIVITTWKCTFPLTVSEMPYFIAIGSELMLSVKVSITVAILLLSVTMLNLMNGKPLLILSNKVRSLTLEIHRGRGFSMQMGKS